MRLTAAVTAAAALGATGCGGDDDDRDKGARSARPAAETDLGAIKTYLLQHTRQLNDDVTALRRDAEADHALAGRVGFDYDRLLETQRERVSTLIERSQDRFRRANPAYEEMEGVVAGVPELADFDVSIDAGGDASDPENAVSFSIKTPAGKTFKQPGNFNFLVETSLVGQTVRTMQGTGWIGITSLDSEMPYWLGLWFGVYPTWQTIGAQVAASAFVIGSFFLAKELQVNWPRRRALATTPRASSDSGDALRPEPS